MAHYGGCTCNPWMNGESLPFLTPPSVSALVGGWCLATAVALDAAGTGPAAGALDPGFPGRPGSGYTPTSQLPPQQQQQQQKSTQQQQGQTQSDPLNRSHRPVTDTRTPTPLSARGGADIG
ncbi:hypothetical protein VE04_10015, partial [Pseudogymnoascus sp. 24MN13]